MRGAVLIAALSAVAAAVGAMLGSQGFDRSWDPHVLCVTCHDDMAVIDQPGLVPPHSVDLRGSWHGLEAFDGRAYIDHLFGSVGLDADDMIGAPEQLADPAQACMGCHLPGPPDAAIPCVMCHGGDDLEWIHSDVIVGPHHCDSCHTDQRPMGPHRAQGCQDCHLEVVGNPRKKAKMVLVERLRSERTAGSPAAPTMGGAQ